MPWVVKAWTAVSRTVVAVPPMDISTTAGNSALLEIHSKPAMIWAMLPVPSQSITRTAHSSDVSVSY